MNTSTTSTTEVAVPNCGRQASKPDEKTMSEAIEMTLGITDLARSKSDRFLNERWLRYEMNRMVTSYPDNDDQHLWRHGVNTSEFHLVFPDEDYTIVFTDQIDHLAIVTQMHVHIDRQQNPIFHYVSEERWRKRFRNRTPAAIGRSDAMQRLALTEEESNMKRIMPATADTSNTQIVPDL